MSTHLHLARAQGPITAEEWRSALADTPGVRLNRRTPDETDAEIYLADTRSWLGGLQLHNGRVSLPDAPDHHHEHHPVREALVHLARLLGAAVVDDAGKPLPWSP